jgi:hypothetical protein
MSNPHDSEHDHIDDSEHDLEHESAHEHDDGVAEYVRLALMAAVIVASLTGWWRNWMSRDWLAFAATLIGGFPFLKRRGKTCASGA